MTRSTQDQRFPVASCHDLDPFRFFAPRLFAEVFQRSDVMDLDVVCGTAIFTQVCQESLLKLRSLSPDLWWLVLEVCLNIPFEGNATPCCYKQFLSFSWYDSP